MFADKFHQFFEVPRAIVYLCAAQFTLDEGIAAVFQVQDNVGLQAVVVTVVGDYAVERGGIDLKVPHAHTFEDESEGLELGEQLTRSESQRGYGDRRVAETALLSAADGSLGTDGRVPGTDVLDDE